MKKVEVNPVVIIITVVAALIIGIATGAIGVGKVLIKKFKQLVDELRKVQKKELEDVRKESKEHIKRKNETISKQKNIIDQMLELFYVKNDKGRCIMDTTLGRFSYNKIVEQRSRLK